MNVKLLRVKEDDLEMMLDWRMRPEITQFMFTNPVLTMETQRKWFENLKTDKTQIRWIIYYNDIPIGSMYLVDIDYENKRCESGWFIAEKEYRSLNLAMYLQWNVLDYIFNVLNLNRNYGYVIDTNKSLIKLLNLCGFETEGILKQHVVIRNEVHDVYITAMTKNAWNEKKAHIHYEEFEIEG